MKSCLLKNIPKPLYRTIQREQEKIKKKKEVKVYSIEQTIIHMLKDYLRCRDAEVEPKSITA